MGFIFGIVNFDKTSVKEEDVYTLANAVKWDGFAEKTVMGATYGVGYCWNTSRNPKAGIYQNENLTVVCDARIYNQEWLLAQGINCANPETMFANAYQKWGERCADRFNGDFSVVIIDHRLQKVFLFRDHIGVRPLCYAMYGKQLLFASHEFGIGKSQLMPNEFSENYFLASFSLFF
jgi:Asparagine synthase (glutamine-hydrolyzing)